MPAKCLIVNFALPQNYYKTLFCIRTLKNFKEKQPECRVKSIEFFCRFCRFTAVGYIPVIARKLKLLLLRLFFYRLWGGW